MVVPVFSHEILGVARVSRADSFSGEVRNHTGSVGGCHLAINLASHLGGHLVGFERNFTIGIFVWSAELVAVRGNIL